MGFKNTAGNFEGPRLILERVGQAVLNNPIDATNPRFQASNNGLATMANNNGSVQVNPDGDLQVISGVGAASPGKISLNNTAQTAFFGMQETATGHQQGLTYNGPAGLVTLRNSIATQITDQIGTSWRPVRASGFEVNCSAALKTDFEQIPGSAMEALRAAGVVMYRRTDADDGDPPKVGPIAETLPGWLVLPPSEPAEAFDADGRALPQPPDTERVDLLAWVSTVAAAVKELDQEIDELRRAAGRPIPRRVDSATVLRALQERRLPPRGRQP